VGTWSVLRSSLHCPCWWSIFEAGNNRQLVKVVV
jgi:hypothetical protein